MIKMPSNVVGSRFTVATGAAVAVGSNVADAVTLCVLVALGVGVSVAGVNVGVAVAGGISVSVGITVGTGVCVGASIRRRIASARACASATIAVARNSPGVRVCANTCRGNAAETRMAHRATMILILLVVIPCVLLPTPPALRQTWQTCTQPRRLPQTQPRIPTPVTRSQK